MDGSIVHIGPGGCGAKGRGLALYRKYVNEKGKGGKKGVKNRVFSGENRHLTVEAAVRRKSETGGGKMIEGLLKIYVQGANIWPGMIIDVWI